VILKINIVFTQLKPTIKKNYYWFKPLGRVISQHRKNLMNSLNPGVPDDFGCPPRKNHSKI
jgi:hypothetical protein